ncbi:polysaccharide biosynthesis protein, partial [Lactobacillus sp. XV13L]|nr:polysaccharide biosynthesis protein [Lactobacillus sp. XV13L]
LAITAVPLLSAAYSKKDWPEVSAQIGNTLQLFFLVMIPSALGMYAVAKPLYILFYRYDQLGIFILQFNSVIAILLALFTVLSAILQGLYQNGLAIKYFLIGFGVKIICQYPCIYLFKTFGPLLATGIGMTVTSLLMFQLLRYKFGFEIRQTFRRTCGILFLSTIMLIIVLAIDWGAYHFISVDNRILSVGLL